MSRRNAREVAWLEGSDDLQGLEIGSSFVVGLRWRLVDISNGANPLELSLRAPVLLR